MPLIMNDVWMQLWAVFMQQNGHDALMYYAVFKGIIVSWERGNCEPSLYFSSTRDHNTEVNTCASSGPMQPSKKAIDDG